MNKNLVVLALALFSTSAFAGRAVVFQDLSSDRRVIVQADRQDNGLTGLTFFSCSAAGPVAQLDLNQCQSFLKGNSFTMSQVVTAILKDGGRGMIRFFVTDSGYGVRSLKRSALGQNLDGLNETTYMGSGNGHNLAQDPSWLVNSLDRAINGNSEIPGMEVGYSKERNIANGYFEGSVEGLTALLLYAK